MYRRSTRNQLLYEVHTEHSIVSSYAYRVVFTMLIYACLHRRLPHDKLVQAETSPVLVVLWSSRRLHDALRHTPMKSAYLYKLRRIVSHTWPYRRFCRLAVRARNAAIPLRRRMLLLLLRTPYGVLGRSTPICYARSLIPRTIWTEQTSGSIADIDARIRFAGGESSRSASLLQYLSDHDESHNMWHEPMSRVRPTDCCSPIFNRSTEWLCK